MRGRVEVVSSRDDDPVAGQRPVTSGHTALQSSVQHTGTGTDWSVGFILQTPSSFNTSAINEHISVHMYSILNYIDIISKSL